MTDDELSPISFRARDGEALSMRHLRAASAPRANVVLQHGLGSNSSVFDYPTRSLARHLAERGYDVFIPHLRGVDAPAANSFGLDAYIEYDIPAILDTVREHSGRERVSWIGHSMGGVLLMMYAIEQPDAPIDRFIAVASALDYRPGYSVFRQLLPLEPALSRVFQSLPFGVLARMNALVAGYGPAVLSEKMNFWRSNNDVAAIKHILHNGFTPIPMQLMRDLKTGFGPDGFSRKQGSIKYLERASAYRLATCLMVGTRDEQCSESHVEATARLLSGASRMRIERFGKRHGHSDDYGHYDLIIGKSAPAETWPVMREFLAS
jgi:pimeloyl-ACP methyl ester carboxylesterase